MGGGLGLSVRSVSLRFGCLIAAFDMCDIRLIGRGGDHCVSTQGGLSDDTFGLPGKGREEQEAPQPYRLLRGAFPIPTLERPGIFSHNRRGTEFHKVGIVRRVQGEYRFALGQRVFAQCLGFASPFGVSNEQAVGEGGDVGVAVGGDQCSGAADGVFEKGEEQQAAVG